MYRQVELVGAILKELARQSGNEGINSRQMNAVIRAADTIIDELREPHKAASEGMGLLAWLASDDTGISSRYMAYVLAPLAGLPGLLSYGYRNPFPRDPDDFGRCVRLLQAAPELRPHIGELSNPEHGHVWNAIATEWEMLEQWYLEDLPSGKSSRVYNRLQEMAAAKPQTQ